MVCESVQSDINIRNIEKLLLCKFMSVVIETVGDSGCLEGIEVELSTDEGCSSMEQI